MYRITLLRKLVHEPHSISISSIHRSFARYILELAYEKCIEYEGQSYFSHVLSRSINVNGR